MLITTSPLVNLRDEHKSRVQTRCEILHSAVLPQIEIPVSVLFA